MAHPDIRELAVGTVTTAEGSETVGPAVGETWEIRDVEVDAAADLDVETELADGTTYAMSSRWDALTSSNLGLEARAKTLVGGDSGRTNPRQRLKITEKGADVNYIVKGRLLSA